MKDLYTKTSRRADHSDVTVPEKLVKIEVAAEYLGVSTSWLYGSGDRKGIPCHRVGRQRRYRLSELHAVTSCPA